MSVDILPLELSFTRPFTVEVARTLTIRNTSSTPLAFKVKTTAPKQYCVRPNAGRIEPGNSFDVTVLLQAMKQNPPPDAKCRDKFLVQCAPIAADQDFSSVAQVLETVDKSQLTERKIRVNWLSAEGDAAEGPIASAGALSTPSKTSTVNGTDDTPRFSSPSGHADSTPQSAPPPYTSEDGADEADEKSEQPKGTVSQAAAVVSETAQMTYEEIKAKLAQAEAQLLNLKDSGLRQRNVKSASGDEKKTVGGHTTQAVKHQAEGVSVQVTALLCLLSFLLAYFFF
ncbi:phosphatidylinositol-binding protein scs2 [Conoideocrella luteorostrata]|uniref:Phosphatidylinositol-binding protein scs2 n=1 Tax=Conoideocrella luteorostrata TaxID=1105319 RepID=A0AAJ0CQR5_9HYPO|nr:phosphatidylinositol-binding protein scs2 [Conoideocrella luteorostrata]